MLINARAAFLNARTRFVARLSKWQTPGEMARVLDVTTVQTPALDLIDAALADVAAGTCLRLMVSLAPQEGKSERISRRFPTWMLHRNPQLRIAIVSYAHRIARRWGKAIRDDIVAHSTLLDLVVDPEAAVDEWSLTGHRGGVYCTGIGGPLTGRAVDCVRGDTLILTDRGYVPIRDLHRSRHRPLVLTVDHATGGTQWRPIVATRAIPGRPIVEVITTAGRRIACTPDHRVYTATRGYVAAADLRPGEPLVAALARGADLRRVRLDVPQTPVRGRQGHPQAGDALVLHQTMFERDDRTGHGCGSAVRDVREHEADTEPQSALVLRSVPTGIPNGRRGLRAVLDDLHAAAIRVLQEATRRRAHVLFPGLRGRLPAHGRAAVPAMPEAHRVEGPGPSVLLQEMPARGEQGRQATGLPAVRPRVLPGEFQDGLLRPGVCEHRARPTHGRFGQLTLQDGHQLRPVVPADAAADPATRRPPVPSLLRAGPAVPGSPARCDHDADQPGRAPHQRAPGGQPAAEPDHAVQDVPRRAPQIGSDTVAMVRDLRGERDTVYDLQVEGNHNFFADQVLVHNCLIIDDPYKDGQQADSVAWQERVRDWWTEVAVPRLGPGVAVVIVATRWRDDDLTGWLQKREDGHVWRVINIPAQADHDPTKGETDPLGRQPGEYLISARGRDAAEWLQRKIAMGTRAWLALCQGRPSPESGNIFKDAWWQRYDDPQWVVRADGAYIAIGFDELLISVDCAFKDEDSSDYVCMQVWARRGIDAYLLDQTHEQLSFVDTVMELRNLVAKWPQALLKLVEDKANGTAVINLLRTKIPGIVPIEPVGSKVARARAVSPLVEAGNVHIPAPELAPWIVAFTEQHKSFPKAANDDQVDATSQGLYRMIIDPLLPDDDGVIEDDEDGEPEGSISAY